MVQIDDQVLACSDESFSWSHEPHSPGRAWLIRPHFQFVPFVQLDGCIASPQMESRSWWQPEHSGCRVHALPNLSPVGNRRDPPINFKLSLVYLELLKCLNSLLLTEIAMQLTTLHTQQAQYHGNAMTISLGLDEYDRARGELLAEEGHQTHH